LTVLSAVLAMACFPTQNAFGEAMQRHVPLAKFTHTQSHCTALRKCQLTALWLICCPL
jgi:hypothetical protein